MYQNPKSATTAGLLGIFLGAFGAHNWYLGEKNKGIIHICMMGGGLLVEIIAGLILPNVLTWSSLLTWATILSVLGGIAGLAMSASGVWGLIEGIMILAGGDAGLAAKGYPVAAPAARPGYGQPPYGQPANMGQPAQSPYGQPYYGQPPYPGQQPYPSQPPMPQQPYQDQPGQRRQPQGEEHKNGQ